MATNDPVLHALVDLCQALGEHPSPRIHDAYQRALEVIREHRGRTWRMNNGSMLTFIDTGEPPLKGVDDGSSGDGGDAK